MNGHAQVFVWTSIFSYFEWNFWVTWWFFICCPEWPVPLFHLSPAPGSGVYSVRQRELWVPLPTAQLFITLLAAKVSQGLQLSSSNGNQLPKALWRHLFNNQTSSVCPSYASITQTKPRTLKCIGSAVWHVSDTELCWLPTRPEVPSRQSRINMLRGNFHSSLPTYILIVTFEGKVND